MRVTTTEQHVISKGQERKKKKSNQIQNCYRQCYWSILFKQKARNTNEFFWLLHNINHSFASGNFSFSLQCSGGALSQGLGASQHLVSVLLGAASSSGPMPDGEPFVCWGLRRKRRRNLWTKSALIYTFFESWKQSKTVKNSQSSQTSQTSQKFDRCWSNKQTNN